MEWSGVSILVIDDISFMTEHELKNWMLDCVSIEILQYLEGIALFLVETSDNSSEATIMNSCIPRIQAISLKES